MEKIALFLENTYLAIRVNIIDRIIKPSYYQEDLVGKDYPHFSELLKEVKTNYKNYNNEWFKLVVKYRDMDSRVSTAELLNKRYNNSKPNLIFHHGAGEVGILNSGKFFLGKKVREKYNVFYLKAAHHKSRNDYLENCQSSFIKWILTFVGSVLLVEEMVKDFTTSTVVSGISMGGIVSTLHYLEFDSATHYVPLLAYNDVSDVFLNSVAFSSSVDKREERQKNISLMNAFTYDKKTKNKDKVHPYLGKYDKFINYKKASAFWDGFDLKTYNVGHSSFLIKAKRVKQLFLSL